MIEAYDSEGEESEGEESGDEESGNETEESERQQTEVTRRGTNNQLLVTNSKRSVIIFVKRLLFIVSERHFKFSVFDIKLSCMQFVRFSKEQYLVQYI